jgi:hypothetical protein
MDLFAAMERMFERRDEPPGPPALMFTSRRGRARFAKAFRWGDKPRWYRKLIRGHKPGRKLGLRRASGGRLVRAQETRLRPKGKPGARRGR